jgi:hypothetical protein
LKNNREIKLYIWSKVKTNKEKNLKKQNKRDCGQWREKKRQMQNNVNISPVSKQGVFRTKETQEEQDKKNKIKLKRNKNPTKKNYKLRKLIHVGKRCYYRVTSVRTPE